LWSPDGGVRGGHDDPQSFKIDAFADALEEIIAELSDANRRRSVQGLE
jgi:hypothetical protein